MATRRPAAPAKSTRAAGSRKVAARKPTTPLGHLKHWLVPHAYNDHRPHLIRAHGLAVLAVLVLGVQLTANFVRPAAVRSEHGGNVLAYATDITPEELFIQTNQQRQANGEALLQLSSQLDQSATLKAQDMFAENYWAHVSPSGIQPWYWFTKVGYNYSYAGENLAKDFDTSTGVMDGWMNSSDHRANILNPNYTDVGFSVENGTLLGSQTTLVVAHYGARPGISVGATVEPKTTPAPAASTPEPMPAATPTSSPMVSPSPSPSASATPSGTPVVALGNITPGEPAAKDYNLFTPLSLVSTLNWSGLLTLGLLLLLLAVYLTTHFVVWRKGLSRWRTTHYRLVAVAQISFLVLVVIAIATSGFGQVG